MTPRFSIRDFGYPEEDPLHYGITSNKDADNYDDSRRSLSDSDEDEEENLDQKAVALYSFNPENDNELRLVENQMVIISYRYGQGWLVAHDPLTGETGLIPEEYVELLFDDDEEQEQQDIPGAKAGAVTEEARPFLPHILQDQTVEGNESDWVDEEDEEEVASKMK